MYGIALERKHDTEYMLFSAFSLGTFAEAIHR